jgi:hypothetical protein
VGTGIVIFIRLFPVEVLGVSHRLVVPPLPEHFPELLCFLHKENDNAVFIILPLMML